MILEVDKEGKIYNLDDKEYEETDIKPITNLISKNIKNGHFYIVMNKKNYNKITKYGRTKYLDAYGKLWTEHYAYAEYDSLFLIRLKRFFKFYIYPRLLALFYKVTIYTDIVECKELARKEGLAFAKKLSKAKRISKEEASNLVCN